MRITKAAMPWFLRTSRTWPMAAPPWLSLSDVIPDKGRALAHVHEDATSEIHPWDSFSNSPQFVEIRAWLVWPCLRLVWSLLHPLTSIKDESKQMFTGNGLERYIFMVRFDLWILFAGLIPRAVCGVNYSLLEQIPWLQITSDIHQNFSLLISPEWNNSPFLDNSRYSPIHTIPLEPSAWEQFCEIPQTSESS